MIRLASFVLFAIACLVAAGSVYAADFAIDLKLEAGKMTKTARADRSGFGAKREARGLLEVKAGQRVHAHWKLRCSATQQPIKDVLVHFFVVRERRLGQQVVPKLDKTVTVESALTMDFQTGSKSEGDLDFILDRPGPYLVRLETVGASVARDASEIFADLDVKVR